VSEYDIGDAEDPGCERCGSSTEVVECGDCGGEGVSHHDCGEDTCCCIDKSPNIECTTCDGAGFWTRCLASKEWCASHPLSPKGPTPDE
jgi:hypothetical protein